MDPEKRMADLINISNRLVDVLQRENTILKARRHGEITDLVDEKEIIGRVYQARVMGLQEDPEQLKGTDEAERLKLRELAQSVDTLVFENTSMLKAAMYASKRVVEIIAETVRDATNSAGTYSQRGTTQIPTHKSEVRGGAISLDQTL